MIFLKVVEDSLIFTERAIDCSFKRILFLCLSLILFILRQGFQGGFVGNFLSRGSMPVKNLSALLLHQFITTSGRNYAYEARPGVAMLMIMVNILMSESEQRLLCG